MAEFRNPAHSTSGDDVIVGTSGDDLIDGWEGNDTISGLAGNDTLFGWSGNDVIDGGDGDDWIFGEAGTDILTGGAGNDTFGEFDQWLNGDTITDFSIGDIILIRDANIATFTFSLQGDLLTFTGATTPTFTGGSITLNGVAGAVFAASAHPEGGVQIVMTVGPPPTPESPEGAVAARSDFDGDGRDDILWRHVSGQVINWLGQANGGFVSNAHANAGTDWHVVGLGDFNGDSRDDVLWRNNDGSLTNWLSQASGSFASNFENAYYQVSTSWDVAGTGDFNGDGRDDVVWRHELGAVLNWLGQSNGSFLSNANANAGTDWHIVGVGDFNGDGRDDVLWRNDNGDVTGWLGQANGSFTSNFENAFYQVDNSWQVAGVGDFNGDGRDDVLWRRESGAVLNWLGQSNGSFVSNANANAGTDWHVASIGDFNGDGRDDVLWRNDNGDVTNWLGQANGSFTSNFENAFYQVDNSWQVQPNSSGAGLWDY